MLDWISLFDGLTESEKSTVSLFTQERLIKAGDILFREGDDATAMYVVKSGILRAYLERSTGEQMLGYNNAGDMVGEMALFDNDAPKRRLCTVRAVEDTLLLVIVDYAIIELSKKQPMVYEKIKAVINERNVKNKNR